MTSSDPKIAAGCDEKCLLNTICSFVRTIYNEITRCRELKAKLKESVIIQVFNKSKLFGKLITHYF